MNKELEKKMKEAIRLSKKALLEAKVVIATQNYGNMLVSVEDALKQLKGLK